MPRPMRARNEKHIEPSIAVVIEEPAPWTYNFGKPFFPNCSGFMSIIA